MKWLIALALVSGRGFGAQSAVVEVVDLAATRARVLHDACDAYRKEHGLVGMSVAVMEKGELVFDEGFGLRDREAQLPAEPSTLYRLASISKPVAATIAMQLVEAGKLDLDAGVGRYVDGLDAPIASLSLRQLLSHTSGLRHYRADRRDNGTQHRTTREALELFVHDPLLHAPGTRYAYSTHAFTLVAAAIENAAGQSYVDCVRERVAAKVAPTLGCELLADDKPERAALYERGLLGVKRATPREDLSWKYGGGGLESTAHDLARFADAVLRAKVVDPAGRDAMWTRTKLDDGEAVAYGLGWALDGNEGVASHTGGQQGTSSALTVVRTDELVIAVLCNTEGGLKGLVSGMRRALRDVK